MGPNLLPENRECGAPDAASSSIMPHEELSQIDQAFFLIEQGIANRLIARKKHGAIFTLQPLLHALCKLLNCHRIPVAFITDELVIPLGEQTKV